MKIKKTMFFIILAIIVCIYGIAYAENEIENVELLEIVKTGTLPEEIEDVEFYKIEIGSKVKDVLKKYKEEHGNDFFATIEGRYNEACTYTIKTKIDLDYLKIYDSNTHLELKDDDLVYTDVNLESNKTFFDLETLEVSESSLYDEVYNHFKELNDEKMCPSDAGIFVKLVVPGDLNGTGEIDVTDLSTMQEELVENIELKGAYKKAADINEDSEIDILDLSSIQDYIISE